MNQSKDGKRRGIPALMAMLFGALVTIMMLPAYAQQEVSPSWYDPWAPPETAAVQSSKPAVAAQKPTRTVKFASAAAPAKSVSRVRRAAKLRAKRSAMRPTAS